jgi:hypothetical protein
MKKKHFIFLFMCVPFIFLPHAFCEETCKEVFYRSNINTPKEYARIADMELKEFDKIKTDDELTSLVQKWNRDGISLSTLICLSNGFAFYNDPTNFPTERTTIKTQHDFSINGGLIAWTLEQLLHCSFPPVTKSTERTSIGAISKEASEKVQTIRNQDFVEEWSENTIDVSKLGKASKLKLAGDSKTSVAVLSRLASEGDAEIRRAVAQNPNAAYRTLQKLCKDNDLQTKKNADMAEKMQQSYTLSPNFEFVRDGKKR